MPINKKGQFTNKHRRLEHLLAVGAFLYFFSLIGVYTQVGSVDEWLFLARNGLSDEYGSYLARTLTLPSIARTLGVETPEAWRTMVISIGLAGTATFWLRARSTSKSLIDLALITFTTLFSPVIRSIFNGQADYDTISFAAYSVLVFSKSPIIAFVCGISLGLNNAEQSLVALLGLSVLQISIRRGEMGRAISPIAGLLVASGAVRLITTGDDLVNRETILFWDSLFDLSRMFHYLPHFYAGAWVVLAFCAWHSWSNKNWLALAGLTFSTVLLPIAAFQLTSDGVRVFAMISFPSLILLLRETLPRFSIVQQRLVVPLSITFQSIYFVTNQHSFEPLFPSLLKNFVMEGQFG